jgi:hypothetical protein
MDHQIKEFFELLFGSGTSFISKFEQLGDKKYSDIYGRKVPKKPNKTNRKI